MSSEISAGPEHSPERVVNGVLLVDKPQNWTSFDCVNYVRRIVATYVGKKPKHTKVGHTGTLDPLATGLLVLLLGKYTKRAPELTKLDKTYEVTMKLGVTSSTGDDEGEKTVISDRQPDGSELRAVLGTFTGELMQTPPIYSAIKINGERAYKLARQGKEVVLEPRKAMIYSLELTSYSYPEVCFITRVSSGTYVRSLVEDIGSSLKTGAYMSNLRRTSVGDFMIDDALPVEKLDIEMIKHRLIQLP
jgi:tRNA pseudouridine55 synthase